MASRRKRRRVTLKRLLGESVDSAVTKGGERRVKEDELTSLRKIDPYVLCSKTVGEKREGHVKKKREW